MKERGSSELGNHRCKDVKSKKKKKKVRRSTLGKGAVIVMKGENSGKAVEVLESQAEV